MSTHGIKEIKELQRKYNMLRSEYVEVVWPIKIITMEEFEKMYPPKEKENDEGQGEG